MKLVKELSENYHELLWWRSGLEKADDAFAPCNSMLTNFSMINFMKCCNIFQVDERGASSKPQSRCIFGLEMAKKFESMGMKTLFVLQSYAVTVSP